MPQIAALPARRPVAGQGAVDSNGPQQQSCFFIVIKRNDRDIIYYFTYSVISAL